MWLARDPYTEMRRYSVQFLDQISCLGRICNQLMVSMEKATFDGSSPYPKSLCHYCQEINYDPVD